MIKHPLSRGLEEREIIVPVIKIEIERLKESICAMLTDRQLEAGSMIKQALDDYLSSDALQNLVASEVQQAVNTGVKRGIHDYYAYGEGYFAIQQAVYASLGNSEVTNAETKPF